LARIRSIKPSFFQSDDVSALPLRARLTWIGLWTQCDDQGRTKDHARLIKAAIWPLDNVSLADIEEDLSTLNSQGRIVRYEVNGQHYLEITNWSEHQRINRPSRSTIPPPTAAAGNGRVPRPTAAKGESVSMQGPLTETSLSTHPGKGEERKGREGDARDDPPPPKCPHHTNTRNPPKCGPCADARRDLARWEAARAKRIAASPQCPLHRGELADNCRICRAEELNPA
jgi:hypothetical protein